MAVPAATGHTDWKIASRLAIIGRPMPFGAYPNGAFPENPGSGIFPESLAHSFSRMKRTISSLVLIVAIAATTLQSRLRAAESSPGHRFAIGTNDFLLDGQRFQIRC